MSAHRKEAWQRPDKAWITTKDKLPLKNLTNNDVKCGVAHISILNSTYKLTPPRHGVSWIAYEYLLLTDFNEFSKRAWKKC